VISPRPDAKFDFSLLAEDKKGRKLVAEFINGGDNSFQTMTSFYARAIDASADSLYLVAVPKLSPEESNFADYCNMKVIEAKDVAELSTNLRQQSVTN
jgi:hypothetical protein